ncbi:MAG: hypothetical protein WA058_01275 [Minisyncoccia bacterium]
MEGFHPIERETSEAIKKMLSALELPSTIDLLKKFYHQDNELDAGISSFRRGDYESLAWIIHDAELEAENIPDIADAEDREITPEEQKNMEDIANLDLLMRKILDIREPNREIRPRADI